MRAHRVDSLGQSLPEPDDAVWTEVTPNTVALTPAPIDAVDTSKYVRQALDREDVGAVDAIAVRFAYDDDHFAVRLDWNDETQDDAVDATESFADKAAVAFPLAPGASVMSMGSKTAPINAWYWRADRSRPYDVLAEGFGDVERRVATTSGLVATATHDDGMWQVVFGRSRAADGDRFVDLASAPPGVAVAVWDGANDERGPLKAYSGEFETLELE